MTSFAIRPLEENDTDWLKTFLTKEWGSDSMVLRGKMYSMIGLPGFIVEKDQEKVGLVIYKIEKNECEIMSLNSLEEGRGIGTALIEKVKETAKQYNCTRIIFITTNDNLHALKFYQRKGFTLAALYPNALEVSRKLKPQIPLIGYNEIPLRDEIELEMKL